LSKNGDIYNIADSAAPIRNKESEIIGVILVFRDETEKIKMRNEILKAEKLKSISLLAGGIAHDFNNILTGIYGNLELIKLNAAEKNRKYIDKAITSLDRATALTKQLLTFAKGGEPIIGAINIRALIQQVADFNTVGSNIKVIYNFPDNLWNIKADKGQISQVISNLVINAKQAMPEGGNLYIELENVVFDEKNGVKNLLGKYVLIRIKDQGIGMPKDILRKIFDPYFTTKQEGSGLGLAIIYSIIEKHNGYIKVESEPGKGTIFEVFIPADTDSYKNEIAKKDHVELFGLKGKNILIMDDDKDIRELGRDIFEIFGCHVALASNGEEAIKSFKEQQYDFVILDLTIRGGMGGADTVKEILKIDKNAKVFVSSGYYSDPIMSDYKKYGFVGVLQKPWKIEDIKDIFENFI
jgi:nitrogen-specific signal transduction histidine kinase